MPKGGSSGAAGKSWKHRGGRQKDDSIMGGGHEEREVEITYTRGGTAHAEKNDEHGSRVRSEVTSTTGSHGSSGPVSPTSGSELEERKP